MSEERLRKRTVATGLPIEGGAFRIAGEGDQCPAREVAVDAAQSALDDEGGRNPGSFGNDAAEEMDGLFESRLFVHATKPQILARMLINLKRLYVRMHSFPQARDITELLLAVEPIRSRMQALERQLSYLLQDCSASIENLLLAAHALGLGACWVGVHPSQESIRHVKEMLSLPASIVPIAAIAVGRPGERPESRTRYTPDHIHFEKW